MAVLGLLLLGAGSAHAGARRALVVGVNDGGVGLEPLRYAEADAERVAEVLIELGSFESGDVEVLVAPNVDVLQGELRERMAADPNGEQPLFLFYYSGHADANGLRMHDGVYSWEALKSDIRGIPADVHLGVLDACRSGAITRVKGAAVSAPFLAMEPVRAEGEAWIAATSDDENAQESDRLQGSFFTHYLLSGLRGAADSGDGRVSLQEAYTYAYDRTVVRTAGTDGGIQHPAYDFQMQGNGDLPLTDVTSASARIGFPVTLDGLITVAREPDGMPVAEVAKRAGQPVVLAVEPGTYLLRKRGTEGLEEVRVHVEDGVTMEVTRWGAATSEQASAKGEEEIEDGNFKQAGKYLKAGVNDWFKGLNPFQKRRNRERAVEGTGEAPLPAVPQSDGTSEAPEGEGETREEQRDQAERVRDEEEAQSNSERKERNQAEKAADEALAEAVAAKHKEARELADSYARNKDEEERASRIARSRASWQDGGASPKGRVNLRHQPAIAVPLSTMLPGTGQAYDGRWGHGALFFFGTYGLFGAGGAITASHAVQGAPVRGPNPALVAAVAFYGWNLADAAWGPRRREGFRPMKGVDVGLGAAWDPTRPHGGSMPTVLGISIDVQPVKYLTFGLDRSGFALGEYETADITFGGRVGGGYDHARFRVSGFVATGTRVSLDFTQEDNAKEFVDTNWVLGLGGEFRVYVTPRYFLAADARAEWVPGDVSPVIGATFGTRFGGKGPVNPAGSATD